MSYGPTEAHDAVARILLFQAVKDGRSPIDHLSVGETKEFIDKLVSAVRSADSAPTTVVIGGNVSDEAKEAILRAVEERKNDLEFMGRLSESIERNRDLLDKLAEVDGPTPEPPCRMCGRTEYKVGSHDQMRYCIHCGEDHPENAAVSGPSVALPSIQFHDEPYGDPAWSPEGLAKLHQLQDEEAAERAGRKASSEAPAGENDRALHPRRPAPSDDDVPAEEVDDRLYLRLKGARERLCVAQTLIEGTDAFATMHRQMLGEAIHKIDIVGGARCPQWSRFDVSDDPGSPTREGGVPVPAPTPVAVERTSNPGSSDTNPDADPLREATHIIHAALGYAAGNGGRAQALAEQLEEVFRSRSSAPTDEERFPYLYGKLLRYGAALRSIVEQDQSQVDVDIATAALEPDDEVVSNVSDAT